MRLRHTIKLAAISSLIASTAPAATLYWDGNGIGITTNPPTTNAGGAGAWNNSTNANWWTGSVYQMWNAAGGQDIADFRGTAGTVTTSGIVNVNQMLVRTNSYVFTGGTVNFTGTQGILDVLTTNGSTFSSGATGNLKVQATGNTATLATASPLAITGSTALTSFELSLATDSNHVIIGNAAALGAAGATVKLTKGVLNLGNTSGASAFTYNNWPTELAGGTIRGRFDAAIWTGALNVTANATILVRPAAATSIHFNNTVNLNANTLLLSPGTTSNGLEFSGVISGTGNLTHADSALGGAVGSSTTKLSAANTFSGVATVSAGNLALNNIDALQNATLNTGLTAGAQSVTFTAVGTNTYNLAALTGADPLALGANSISVGTKAGSTLFSAEISGTGGLTKVGASSTLTLSAVSTYTGATSVTAGTLALTGDGALNASSGITVNGASAKLVASGTAAVSPVVTLTQGTLTGSGSVGTVNVGSGTGGIISNNDGVSGAPLTIGSLNLSGGATLNIFSQTTAAPLVVTTLTNNSSAGTVTLTANNPGGWTNGATYSIVGFDSLEGTGGNNFTVSANNLSARQSATWGQTASAITVTINGDTPFWTGAANGNWNTTDANWKLVTANTVTSFLASDDVLFNDNATGSTTLEITGASASPNTVAFNNSSKNYTVNSSGGFGIASGSLSKSGTGALTLNTANSYAGGTTLVDGTLNLGHANALGSATGTVTISGGTLDNTSGSALTIGNHPLALDGNFAFTGTNNLNLGAGSASLGTSTGTSRTITVNGGTLTLGGSIANGVTANALVKAGPSTLVLAAANSFSGGVTLNAGTLALGNAQALGTGALTVNGGSLDNASGSAVTHANVITTLEGDLAFLGTSDLHLGNGAISLGAAAGTSRTVSVAAGTLTLGGVISDGATAIGLTKAGAGTLLLTNANLHTGVTTINAGTLKVGTLNALGATTAGTVINAGGTLDFNGIVLAAEPLDLAGGKLSNSGAAQINAVGGPVNVSANSAFGGTGRWDIRAATSSLTIPAGVTVTKVDANQVQVVGRDTLIDGSVVINSGIFGFHTSGNYTGTGSITVNVGAEFQTGSFGSAIALNVPYALNFNGGTLNNSDSSGAGGIPVYSGNAVLSGTVTISTGGSITMSGVLSGPGNIVKTGANALNLTGSNTLTGALTQNAGSTVLSGANSFAGPIAVNAGAMIAQNAAALGSSSGVTVANNARLEIDNVTITGRSIITNGGGSNFWGGLQGRSGTAEWTGPVTIGSVGSRIGAAAGTFTVSGVIDSAGQPHGVTFRPAATGVTVVVSGANTYLGDTSLVGGGGVVRLAGGANRLPVATNLLFGLSNTSCILDLNGQNQEVAGLSVVSGTANEITSVAPATLTVNGATAASTFSGSLTGAISLVKSGANTLTLTGARTYTGNTTVNAGTLSVNSASFADASTVTLASGAILDLAFTGSDTIASLVVNGTPLAAGTYDATTSPTFITGTGSLTIPTPVLSASATVSSFAETAASPASVVTVSVSAAPASDLVVSLSADATEVTVPASVTILAGQTSANFNVAAVNDGIADGDQLVSIGVSAAGHTAGSVNVTVTDVGITDPFVGWQASKFTVEEQGDVNISGPDADPDGDGLKNSLEYAFGSEPKSNSASFYPQSTISAGALVLNYLRPVGGVSGVTYTIETVSDLQAGGAGWTTATPVTDYVETTSTAGVPAGFEKVTISFTSTVGAGGKKFGRVFVSY